MPHNAGAVEPPIDEVTYQAMPPLVEARDIQQVEQLGRTALHVTHEQQIPHMSLVARADPGVTGARAPQAGLAAPLSRRDCQDNGAIF